MRKSVHLRPPASSLRMRAVICMAALGVFLAVPGYAWGPKAQQAIVATAVRILSKEGGVQLTKLEKDIKEGASASLDVVERICPGFATGPVRGVESEMNLLDSVRGDVIDPFFAYRLGIVGRLVAQLTAPLLDEEPSKRDAYYADVDRHFAQAPLKPSARKHVDPVPYFERVTRLANARKEMILRDYQDGVGFDALAKASLPDDLGRSIDAVADVWNTILTKNVLHANTSEGQLREYVIGALDFYIKRGNEGEVDANYRRLAEITAKTPDMSKRIGDMFFEAGYFERAIGEYQAVLAKEPHRRDVVEKIAAYYTKVGDDELAAKRLSLARDAYAKAAQTDALHPTAEAKRLQVEQMIAEHDTLRESARRTLDQAGKLEIQADQLSLQRKIPEAISALKDAQAKYEEVPGEFPVESQNASTGLAKVENRLRELRSELIQNTQALSGSAFAFDMQQLAIAGAKNLDQQALRALMSHELSQEISRLKTDYEEILKIKP